ncbi:unnamed protein product, partial [Ectocarpus sp. 12 AP-2014]
ITQGFGLAVRLGAKKSDFNKLLTHTASALLCRYCSITTCARHDEIVVAR